MHLFLLYRKKTTRSQRTRRSRPLLNLQSLMIAATTKRRQQRTHPQALPFIDCEISIPKQLLLQQKTPSIELLQTAPTVERETSCCCCLLCCCCKERFQAGVVLVFLLGETLGQRDVQEEKERQRDENERQDEKETSSLFFLKLFFFSLLLHQVH